VNSSLYRFFLLGIIILLLNSAFVNLSFAIAKKYVLIIPPKLNYENARDRKVGLFVYMAMDDAVLIVSRKIIGEKGILLKKIPAVSPRQSDAKRINNFYSKLKSEGKAFLTNLLEINKIDMIIWADLDKDKITLYLFGKGLSDILKKEININVFDFKNFPKADTLIEEGVKELIYKALS